MWIVYFFFHRFVFLSSRNLMTKGRHFFLQIIQLTNKLGIFIEQLTINFIYLADLFLIFPVGAFSQPLDRLRFTHDLPHDSVDLIINIGISAVSLVIWFAQVYGCFCTELGYFLHNRFGVRYMRSWVECTDKLLGWRVMIAKGFDTFIHLICVIWIILC